MKKINAAYILASGGIALTDQLIKSLICQNSSGEALWGIDGFVEIVCCKNTGAAFSILSGNTGLILLISIILLAGIVGFVFGYMRLTRAGTIAVVCLIGGGVGNMMDRVYYGYVIDYIHLSFVEFPIFNFADIVITGSVCFLMILLLSNKLEKDTGERYGRDS